jgi:short subunit dehydrogenase-like uncharacterized protein
MTDRQFDLVLFGATGFTGGLVADYLATAAPADMRLALAGRDVAALTRCRDRLPSRAPGGRCSRVTLRTWPGWCGWLSRPAWC